jgi:hypothetical protein
MTGTTIAANAWTAGAAVGSASQFNFLGTGGNVFELFDVSLTEGSVAPPFVTPDYATELLACKRYWQKIGGSVSVDFLITGPAGAGAGVGHTISFPEMRAAPTALAVGSFSYTNTSAITFAGVGARSMGVQAIATAAAHVTIYSTGGYVSLNARL